MALSAKDLWQGYQSQRTELHKQLMILSVAGLGYNLARDGKTESLKINFPPASDWEISTLGFFITVVATLIVFFFASAHLKSQFRLFGVQADRGDFASAILKKFEFGYAFLAGLASFIAYLSFGIAMWYAMSAFLQ